MRPNGFVIVVDMALHAGGETLLSRHRNAIVLGTLRENVRYIPGIRMVCLNPSFTHFYRPGIPGGFVPLVWPGPRREADRFFGKAVVEIKAGRTASAFVHLGRVSHLLTDMSCPVHAQSVAHDTDAFEWCVEAMRDELEALPVPHIEDREKASDLIEGLALFAQGFAADKTNSPWGRVLKRMGLRNSVSAPAAREQARKLIPVAAGYTASLFRLFQRKANTALPNEVHLSQMMDALEMPPAAVQTWFRQVKDFCCRHGGKNRYSAILELMDQLETKRS